MSAFDPRGLDVNAILRDALHQRGTATEVDGPLEEAVRKAVPAEAVPAVFAALRETVARVAAEEGLDGGDALHSILANLSRYRFTIPPGGESWVAREGRLVGASEPAPSSSPSAHPTPPARGGCAGMILLVASAAAALMGAS